MCIQCGANDDSDACRECWGQHFGEPVVGYDDGGGGDLETIVTGYKKDGVVTITDIYQDEPF